MQFALMYTWKEQESKCLKLHIIGDLQVTRAAGK